MAQHIFLLAAVALVVIVQQNDAATITVADVEQVPLVAEEYVSNVTRILKSSISNIQQNFDSVFKDNDSFLKSKITTYTLEFEKLKLKFEDSPKERHQKCKKAIENSTDLYNQVHDSLEKCIDPLKQVAKDHIDIIKKIEKNVEEKLDAIKEDCKQCKIKEDSSDVTHCASKIIGDASIELAKETGPLDMIKKVLKEHLDGVTLALETCSVDAVKMTKTFLNDTKEALRCLND